MNPEDRLEQLGAEVARLRAEARSPEQRARAASTALDEQIRKRAGGRQNVMTVRTEREPRSAGSTDVDAAIRASVGCPPEAKETR